MKKTIKITLLTLYILILTLAFSSPNTTLYAANTPNIDTYKQKYSAKKKKQGCL